MPAVLCVSPSVGPVRMLDSIPNFDQWSLQIHSNFCQWLSRLSLCQESQTRKNKIEDDSSY